MNEKERKLWERQRRRTERDENAHRARPDEVRKAWEAAGIDLDELKRLYEARRARGPGGDAA